MSDAPQNESGPPAAAAAEAEAALPPPPEPPRPPPPRDPPEPKASHAAAWALSLLVLTLALVAAAPYWTPWLLPLLPWGGRQADNLRGFEERLDAAESQRKDAAERLGRLEAQQASQGAPGAAPADTAALDRIGARLDALEQRNAATAAPDTAALTQSQQQMGARLDALDAKLDQLAGMQSAGDAGDVRLLAALAALRAALAGSGPFEGELRGVLALALGDAATAAALQPLSGAAAAGIPSAALLAERFRAAGAPAILRAGAAAPQAGDDLAARVLARVQGLVTIRRIDAGGSAAPADATEAAVRTAGGAFEHGDLAGAIAALQGLSGAAADAAKPTLAAAQQRRDAESAVSSLAQKTAARLAASAAPPPPQEAH